MVSGWGRLGAGPSEGPLSAPTSPRWRVVGWRECRMRNAECGSLQRTDVGANMPATCCHIPPPVLHGSRYGRCSPTHRLDGCDGGLVVVWLPRQLLTIVLILDVGINGKAYVVCQRAGERRSLGDLFEVAPLVGGETDGDLFAEWVHCFVPFVAQATDEVLNDNCTHIVMRCSAIVNRQCR